MIRSNSRCKRLKRVYSSKQNHCNQQQYEKERREIEVDDDCGDEGATNNSFCLSDFSQTNTSCSSINSITSTVPTPSPLSLYKRQREAMLHKWQLMEAWEALERNRNSVIEHAFRPEDFPTLVPCADVDANDGGKRVYEEEYNMSSKVNHERMGGGMRCGKKRSFLESNFQ